MRGLKENKMSALQIAQINKKIETVAIFNSGCIFSAYFLEKLKSTDCFKMSIDLNLKLYLGKMLRNIALRNRHFMKLIFNNIAQMVE